LDLRGGTRAASRTARRFERRTRADARADALRVARVAPPRAREQEEAHAADGSSHAPVARRAERLRRRERQGVAVQRRAEAVDVDDLLRRRAALAAANGREEGCLSARAGDERRRAQGDEARHRNRFKNRLGCSEGMVQSQGAMPGSNSPW
jgi:hypothetical protein